jgi:hypothetical protein
MMSFNAWHFEECESDGGGVMEGRKKRNSRKDGRNKIIFYFMA